MHEHNKVLVAVCLPRNRFSANTITEYEINLLQRQKTIPQIAIVNTYKKTDQKNGCTPVRNHYAHLQRFVERIKTKKVTAIFTANAHDVCMKITSVLPYKGLHYFVEHVLRRRLER